MNYARKKFNLADYLPKFRMPNRPWVCNLSKDFHFQDLVFTKLGDDFKTWVDDKMKEREIFLINKHSFTINVLPEFAEGFTKSKRVPSKLHYLSLCIVAHGRSNFLLRNPPKKRPKLEELKEVEMINIDLDQANAQLYAEVSDLKQQINELKAINIENLQYKDKIESLILKGVLNKDGEERITF